MQQEFFMNATHRWNIKTGATRSGKTYMDYFVIPKRIRNCTGNGLIVLIGNTQGTLERNIFEPMRNIWGETLVGKVRGRRPSLEALIARYDELAIDKNGEVYICQADCIEDAEFIKKELSERFGANVTIITDIGPVIGLHSGPGTIAIFFLGKNR